MFKKISTFKKHHQSAFAVIISLSVISFWRGAWGLMDLYIFPNNYALSLWVSLIAGLLVLGATHYIVEELL